jgi:hypothetical protein
MTCFSPGASGLQGNHRLPAKICGELAMADEMWYHAGSKPGSRAYGHGARERRDVAGSAPRMHSN